MLQLVDAGPRMLETMTSSLSLSLSHTHTHTNLLGTYRFFLWMMSAHALCEKKLTKRTFEYLHLSLKGR
jgi:hypothetical protein